MNKHIYFITKLLVILTPLCSAMEQEQKAEIINTITTNTNALSIFHISNDQTIMIFPDKYTIYDTSLKTTSYVLSENKKNPSVCTYSNINKERNKLAVYHNNILKIYQLTNRNPSTINIAKGTGKLVFSDDSNTIFMIKKPYFDSVLSIDCTTKEIQSLPIKRSNYQETNFIELIAHPTQKTLSCSIDNELFNINYASQGCTFQKDDSSTATISQFNHSHDGKFTFIKNSDNVITILNNFTNKKDNLVELNEENLYDVMFLPNSHVLAVFDIPTIDRPSAKISFWNITNFKLITTITIEPMITDELKTIALDLSDPEQPRLSFSPNNRQCVLAILNQCFVIQVPFEVQKVCNAKFQFDLWALNVINSLPKEVNHLIINMLLRTYTKYH